MRVHISDFEKIFPVTPKKIAELKRGVQRIGLNLALVQEQFTKGGGRGGQKVNKSSNCVIIKYPPLGIVIRCHRERSRALNRFLALRQLVERIEERMTPKVERWDAALWGPLSEENFVRRLTEQGYSVTRFAYPPGTVFGPHTHGMDKKDAVLSGRFKIVMGGREVVLGPGDGVFVPAGVAHAAAVVGDEPVVSLDAEKR